MLTVIETTGIVNEQHQIVLDESLPLEANERVKVIILVNKEKLMPLSRKAGSTAGLIKMSPDFNDPLEAFRKYM